MPVYRSRGAIVARSHVSAALSTSTAIWSSWALIAIEHEAEAKTARARLVERYGAGEDWGPATTAELHASMVAITASAFAIDGFCGTVAQWIEIPPELREAWERNGTARHARILETLKRGFVLGGRAGSWPDELKWLFGYRDANVHFEEIFRDAHAAEHPVLPGVTWERAAYTSESASRTVDLALDVLTTCVTSPVTGNEPLADLPRRFAGIVASYGELRPS